MQQPTSSSLLTLVDALAKIQQAVIPTSETETIPLTLATNRVLAEPLSSTINVPGFDSSAMDGYALRFHTDKNNVRFEVIGKVTAGMSSELSLDKGQAIRIMTGAPLPPYTDAVVIQENVTVIKNVIKVNSMPEPHANFRSKGSSIASGEVLVGAGERLNAAKLMLCASAGVTTIRVFKKVRVGIVSTGDELIDPKDNLATRGKLYDCNRIGIASLLEPLNIELIDYGIVSDELEALKTLFKRARQEVDALVSSGGVSVGDADLVKDVLKQTGQIKLWKVAIKPGKPFALGRVGAMLFCGLPGNPVSAYVTTQKLVVPALKMLQHERVSTNEACPTIQAQLLTDIHRQSGRQEYLRANCSTREDGSVVVTPQKSQSSAAIQALANANCYIVVPAEVNNLHAGEEVVIELF